MPRKPAPLLHDVYELTLDLYRLVPSFPKSQRFVLGQRIENAALDVLFGVDCANDPAGRMGALGRASRGLDELRLLVRLGKDLGFLTVERHEALAIRFDEVGRKLGGWKRWAATC